MRILLINFFLVIGLTGIFNTVEAQVPNISYSTSSIVYTDGMAITPLSPTNSGGAITGGYSIPANFAVVNNPYGVATDASGNIYAASFDGYVYKYNSSGTLLLTFTDDNMVNATGVAVDASGVVYVADPGGSSVWEFNASGTKIAQISISLAYGIALDASKNVYVVRGGGVQSVSKIAVSTNAVTTLLTGFTTAYGIAIDGSGNMFVSQTTPNNIIKIANAVTGGTTKTTFATGFSSPGFLYSDATGNIYVADNGNNAIKKITSGGVVSTFLSSGMNAPFQAVFDASGSNPNLYEADNGTNYINKSFYTKYSINIALPAGLSFNTSTGVISGTPTVPSPVTAYTIYAYNSSGSGSFVINISVFTPPPAISYTPSSNAYFVGAAITPLSPVNTGGTVHSIGFNNTGTQLTGATLNQPWGMATDPSGNIYVTNWGNGTISEYSSTGVFITNSYGGTFAKPSGIVFDSSGNGFVSDQSAGIVYEVPGGGGAKTALITGLASPYAIAIDASNNLFLAENSNGDVVKYSTAGGPSLLTVKGGLGNGPALKSPVGVATDAAGNIYILDFTNKWVTKYNSLGTYQTKIIKGLSLPLGLSIDGAGNVYVGDVGSGGAGTSTGFVSVYNQSGTLYTTVTSLNDPEGLVVDSQGDLYVASQTNATVYQYTPTQGYFLSSTLPPGLSFNVTTGQFTGTPLTSFAPIKYKVKAYNSAGFGSAFVTLSCYRYLTWAGSSTSTNWNTASNWSPAYVPTLADTVRIGSTASFTNGPPVISATANAGSITFGTQGPVAAGVSVNSGIVLNVLGAITYQSDSKSTAGFTASLSGAGTINAGSVNVIANTALTSNYTETLVSSVNNLNITSNIALTSVAGSHTFNSTFNITGGTALVNGIIQTTNTGSSTSTFSIIPSTTVTLQLAGASALSGLSSNGTNIISLKNTGTTVEYSGAAQTVYTDASITGLPTGISYQNIKFSGTGIKTAASGNLNITGDFTNTLINDAGDYINLSSPTVNFNGTTQNLAGGSGTGTTLYSCTFSGAGTKTITGGNFNIASSGILTMSGSNPATILAAGGFLTLNSDATGSATIRALTGPQITGNVNVQRFITGGQFAYRGYRLLSSTVYGNTDTYTNNIYSLNYLIKSSYLTGTTGTSGGFDRAGNPTLFLFRENLAPSNASFTSGNFRGVNTIGTAPNYNYLIDGDPGTFNIPAGNGYLFFFRGDRNASGGTLAAETSTAYTPTSTTLSETGILNQGQVTVKDWYTPSSAFMGFTNTAGNSTVQGFNLVGNPYPSSIDWDTYNTSSSTTGIYAANTSPFTYVIDPVSKNYSVYQAHTGGVGTIAKTHANIIPSGQGFFVVALNASAQLVFNESAKVDTQATGAIGNLFLGPPPQAAVNQYLQLKLTKDSLTSGNTDGLFISFDSSAKPEYTLGEDAMYKIGNGTVSLSSMSADGVSLAINKQAFPKQQQLIIGLNVNGTKDGLYQLNLETIKSIPQLYDIWLMDAVKKDSLDIRHNPTYDFNIYKSDAATYGSKRFSLVLRQNPALGIHLLNFAAAKATAGAQTSWKTENEQNYTNFTVERSTDGGVTFNVLGGFASNASGTYSFLDKNPPVAEDQYRLKIEDLNGAISYSNIVTLMYANTGNTITVNNINAYPNPASSIINVSIDQRNLSATGTYSLPNPSYDIMITNSSGSIIKTVTSTQPQWQDDVSNLLPGAYFIRVVNTNNKSVVGSTKFVKL